MKKIYQTPETSVMTIIPSRLMAASEYIPVSTEDYDGEMSIESRQGGSFWDDAE